MKGASILLLLLALIARAEPAQFFRAINLNGPPLKVDGRQWEGKDTTNLTTKGNTFENQSVVLKPATDPERAKMIRSSVWGANVDVEVSEVPTGQYQVFLYVWEDNHTERFNILLNDKMVQEGLYSGNAGSWKRLGPWKAEIKEGKIKISARTGASGNAANLSGLEIWKGEGEVPAIGGSMDFVSNLTEEHTAFFEKRVRPILVNHCAECHSKDAKRIRGGLVLDSRAGVVKGGDSGPLVAPGAPEASLLIHAVKHLDPDMAMPPKKKISDLEIADLEQWVRMGVPYPGTNDTSKLLADVIDWDKARQFWSFQPIKRVEPPKVKNTRWPRNDIDKFILARLEKEKLTPANDAEKRALVRRATYDLTGLPPTPEEVDAFLNDNSSNAFEKVIDRLLASSAYGERWGRHWLDVVRYADTAGDNSDFPIPQIYKYRNWVISAINRDMPYDQFIKAQLAGDLLPAKSEKDKKENIIATGYIANARRFGSRVSDYPQHLTIEDTIDNVGRAFLGLTVSCARCHNHKFDPITNEDYYALYGIFHSTRYPWPGIELEQKQRDFVPLVPETEFEAAKKAHRDKQKELEARLARLEKEAKEGTEDEKKEKTKKVEQAKKDVERHKKSMLPVDMAYAVAEAQKFEDVTVQLKGDPAKPGKVVPRGFLTVLSGGKVPGDAKQSGRMHLADWLIGKDNPLPARVMANRIWLYHFGKGIVPTPNDYGKQGKPPTHPELLDYLASEFVSNGWSLKKMHKFIMLSRTYQLSTARSDEALERDANNDLLSSYPRRRLDAESIRDTLLVLGGQLEKGPGEAHPFPPQYDWNFTQHNPFKAVYDTKKRSVYLMTQRIQKHPFMAIFDGADPAGSTPLRLTSTTPLQALFFLNDPLVHDQSSGFAKRILDSASNDETRLQNAFRMALARSPDSAEIEKSNELLAALRAKSQETGTAEDKIDKIAWQSLVRALFRLNEFVYLD